ncbi:hypothetical protein B9S64_31775 [Streptomyces sp. SM18]|nr:hypothetical protein B9S64_31775 [Streptomyces sp. SM18]
MLGARTLLPRTGCPELTFEVPDDALPAETHAGSLGTAQAKAPRGLPAMPVRSTRPVRVRAGRRPGAGGLFSGISPTADIRFRCVPRRTGVELL